MSPEQQALYAAVVANPDDDLPRLVYADWLEEHGQPDRAEFIRVQCRLSKTTPADAGYFDLHERRIELTAVLEDELERERPKLPVGFDWEEEERGFLYRVTYNGSPRSLDTVEGHFDRLARLVPLRGLWAAGGLADRLSEFVARPAMERFDHLFVDPGGGFDVAGLIGALAGSPHVGRLRDLQFPFERFTDASFATFCRAETLSQLTRFDAGWEYLTRRANAALRSAAWRESLEQVQLFGGQVFPTVAARVTFPRLHSLCLFNTDWTPALAGCLNSVRHFPRLAELTLFGDSRDHPSPAAVTPLDRPLAALNLHSQPLLSGGLGPLLGSTAAGLRLLALHDLDSADDWSVGLTRLTLPSLRVLKIASNRFTADGLLALAAAPFWPTLTEVYLNAHGSGVTSSGWAAFLRAVRAPNLRRLEVRAAKVGAGVRELIGNLSLTALHSLHLPYCEVANKAARAVLTAPQFQRLAALDLSGNRLGDSPEVLTDPGVMPNTKLIKLGKVKLPPAVIRKLRRRPEVKFEKS